eukprot:m.54878 g.54878  ORF g.54878 m.54878 type:complete len:484 (+) comp11929_c2_seq2:50-1501(+)
MESPKPAESPGNSPSPPYADPDQSSLDAQKDLAATGEAAVASDGPCSPHALGEPTADAAVPVAEAAPADGDPALAEDEEGSKGAVYEDVVAKHPSREKLLGVHLQRGSADGGHEEEDEMGLGAAAEDAEPIYAEDDFEDEEDQAQADGEAAATDKGHLVFQRCIHFFLFSLSLPFDLSLSLNPLVYHSRAYRFPAYFQRVQNMFEERLEKLYEEEGREYQKLPMFEEKPAMAGYRNSDSNRYSNILPYDETRVAITPTAANGNTDYINANFLRDNKGNRTYISTQGPLANTIVHFWQMVWEQQVCGIVMLCNLRESGRAKCQQYWPTAPGRSATHGAIKVTLNDQLTESGYLVRKLTLRNQSETRELVQFHFTDWPDHGVPRTTTSLLNLRHSVRQHCPEGVLLVHCSAGVGRSGTFIALDRLLDAVAMRAPAAMLDVFTMVAGMRAERYWMVQAEEQYFFLHFCVRDAVLQSLFDLADSSQA